MNAQPLCLSCLPDGILHHHHIQYYYAHFRFYFNCPHILLCDGNKHIIIIIISRAIQTVRVPAPPIAPMPTMDRELETFRKTNL